MAAPENPEGREIDAHSGRETTGHEWDGIKELDTPLPRWWLYIFYASIVTAVIYWVLMPAWPLLNGYTKGVLNYSDRRVVAEDIRALESSRAHNYERLQRASYREIVADPQLREFAFAAGQTTFNDNCRTCHGAGGAGAPGFPSLADDVWIWGGTLENIEHTITVGVRSSHDDTQLSQMPAFGRDRLLPEEQLGDVTEYVLSLGPARNRTHPNTISAQRGAAVFAQNCAVCHGPTGAGDRSQGAPSLRDDIWLYGGSREEVRRQIELGRGGVMPNWDRRFDSAVIRALAVYVFALGGGEATPPAATPAPHAPATGGGAAAPAQR